MKMNWGTGIALVLTAFAGSMAFAVYKAMQQDFDLVSEDYYAQEVAYQEVIDSKKNALTLDGRARLFVSETGVSLELPEDLMGQSKDVEVWMYCEQEADNDFKFEHISTTENSFEVPFKVLSPGRWVAKTTVKCKGITYYMEPEIRF